LSIAEQLAALFPTVRSQWGSCGRKRSYTDLGAVLATKERRERTAGVELNVYPCDYAPPDAPHWHLSSHEPTHVQMEALIVKYQAAADELFGAIEACQRRLRELRRQEKALMQSLSAQAHRLVPHPSVSAVRASYESYRDDLCRLDSLWGEVIDVTAQHNTLLLVSEAILGSQEQSPENLR
jgi:hypothetical protein